MYHKKKLIKLNHSILLQYVSHFFFFLHERERASIHAVKASICKINMFERKGVIKIIIKHGAKRGNPC